MPCALVLQSGEALGAIAEPSTLELLERLSSDERPEVAETCQIASRRVRWVLENGDKAEELVRGSHTALLTKDAFTHLLLSCTLSFQTCRFAATTTHCPPPSSP